MQLGFTPVPSVSYDFIQMSGVELAIVYVNLAYHNLLLIGERNMVPMVTCKINLRLLLQDQDEMYT